MRRPPFTLRALLVLTLAVACFFSGIRFERERKRREDEAAALAAKNTERAAALARVQRRMALAASTLDLQRQQVAAEEEARERINRELFLQEQKVDQLMARFNALMDEERRRDRLGSAAAKTDKIIRESLQDTAK